MRTRPLLLGGLLLLALSGCSAPPYPHGSIDELFPAAPRPTLQRRDGVRPLQYLELAQPGAPRIVFIHGSPGDWRAFAGYLRQPALQQYGPLLVPDRAGFGGSGAGAVVPELQAQADFLAPLLDGPGAPAILVGHSLGAPIALRMAIDHPARVRGVLLLAGSVAPELERPRWYNELARWKPVQWLIPDALVWSNRELYGLPRELERLAYDWPKLRVPVYAVQGSEDRLVDPRTADYLETALAATPHRIWRLPEQGHFFLWKRPDIVVSALQTLIADTEPAPAAAAARRPERERSAINGVE